METFQIRNEFEVTDHLTTFDPFSDGFPQLSEVLEENSPIPAYSVLLGVCEDGVPLLLDLTDPYSGSYLIAADDHENNFSVLLNLLTSTYLVNNENEVNIHIITPHPEGYAEVQKTRNLKICLTPNQKETTIAIEEFGNLVLARRSSSDLLPFHILAVDGLVDLYNLLNPQIRSLLHLVIEHGPEVGVWVMATIEAGQINPRIFNILESFPSRILSSIRNPKIARYLSGVSQSLLYDLLPGIEAIVSSQGNFVSVNIPQVWE
jgi:hypothetical protein